MLNTADENCLSLVEKRFCAIDCAMDIILNLLTVYFLLPLYICLGLILVFFNIPSNFYISLFALAGLGTFIVLVSSLFYSQVGVRLKDIYGFISANKKHRQVAYLTCILIVMLGPIDVLLNGFKLADPLSYAELSEYGRFARHITTMCWILIPVAFLFIQKNYIKYLLIAYAIIFPILIIDRNRLFMSFFVLIFCMLLTPAESSERQLKKSNVPIYFLVVLVILIFAAIGQFRSGDAFLVESSGEMFTQGFFPLSDTFYLLPEGFQQVVLYLTTPQFNFATIDYNNFINEDFLKSQLSPFDRESFDKYPYAPVLIERFNVGTEFFPWLLYGGLPLVAIAISALVFVFIAAVQLLKKHPNIFTLLIFLRVAYVTLFAGFAPQFFILLNLGFFLLMMLLWMLSVSLGGNRPQISQ